MTSRFPLLDDITFGDAQAHDILYLGDAGGYWKSGFGSRSVGDTIMILYGPDHKGISVIKPARVSFVGDYTLNVDELLSIESLQRQVEAQDKLVKSLTSKNTLGTIKDMVFAINMLRELKIALKKLHHLNEQAWVKDYLSMIPAT